MASMIGLPSRSGAVGSRWVPWSSKPVARRSARRGGFDSHAFPPRRADVDGSPASPERRAAARRGPAAARPTAPTPTRSRRSRATSSPGSGRAWRPASAPTAARRARRRPSAARLDGFADPAASGLTTVINATGRDPPHQPRARAVADGGRSRRPRRAAGAYSLLEFDRDAGRRGPRFRAAEDHLIALTGAEDALVTINNAAALVARRRAGRASSGVAVSRGELVEIGGGVRIPEIVRRAGARLIEVGTTNRTRAADFEAPLADGPGDRRPARPSRRTSPRPGSSRRPIRSSSPGSPTSTARSSSTTSAAGRCSRPPRSASPTSRRRRERLAAGADLVTFSGDKLVGGPQAGLIVGRADLIARIRRDPLARAVRPDKVTLAALAATLGLYRAGRATTDIPVWRMIAATPDELRPAGRRDRRRAAGDGPASASSVDGDGVDGRRRVAAGRDARVGRARRRRAGRRTRLAGRLRRGRAGGRRPGRGRRGPARPADRRPGGRRRSAARWPRARRADGVTPR